MAACKYVHVSHQLLTSRSDLSSTGMTCSGAVWSKTLAQYILKGMRVPQTRKEMRIVATTSAIYSSLEDQDGKGDCQWYTQLKGCVCILHVCKSCIVLYICVCVV